MGNNYRTRNQVFLVNAEILQEKQDVWSFVEKYVDIYRTYRC